MLNCSFKLKSDRERDSEREREKSACRTDVAVQGRKEERGHRQGYSIHEQ